MKLLVLIIAHDDPIYIGMQEQWKRYMNNYDSIKCYFIKYNTNIDNYVVIDESNNTIYVKGNDSLIPGCLDKTIKSLYYLLENKYEFDYLLRTNLSTVWNFENLYHFIEKTNCFIAGIKGNHKFNNKYINFIAGSGILLRRDACKYLMENRFILNYSIIDDVAIGIILKSYINNNKFNYKLNRFEMYKYENNSRLINKSMIENYSHIRCKCDINRHNTIELMKLSIDLINNK